MSAGDAGIVTPEAVVLAFDTAGVGSRLPAIGIDLAVQLAAFLLTTLGFAILGRTPFGAAGVYIALFLIGFCYPVILETLWKGRTLGKAALGLRVVTVEGAPIRFRHALVRAALGLVELWASSGSVAIIVVLLSKHNQRLGDMAAGTLVIRERTGAKVPASATFAVPWGWDGYAATLDVSGLTAADYQAVRAFLLRAPTLDAWTRDRIAREIAGPLLGRLRHTPPPGIQAEGFLACVAALWQQRQRGTAPTQTGEPAWQAVGTPAQPERGSAPEVVGPAEGGFIAPG